MSELAIRRPAWIEPSSHSEARELAKTIAASKLFGISSPEACFVVMMRASELGIGLATAMLGMHVINGRPTLSADLQVAICVSRKEVCKYFRLIESTDELATWETWREGHSEPTRFTFTMKDAERAKLTKNPTWQAHPRQMLKKRASAFLARDVYPDLFVGFLSPEEAQELPPVGRVDVVQAEPRSEPARMQGRAYEVVDGHPPPAVIVDAVEATGRGQPADVYATIYIEHRLEMSQEDTASAGIYLTECSGLSGAAFQRCIEETLIKLVAYQNSEASLKDLAKRASKCIPKHAPAFDAFGAAYRARLAVLTAPPSDQQPTAEEKKEEVAQ